MPYLNQDDVKKLLSNETLSQPKILLIEDCICDTALIKNIISDYFPFTIIDTSDTKQGALDKLGYNSYDLVLLDLHLPDTIDLSDIGEIRIKCPLTPLIIVTGGYNQEAVIAAKKYRANGIISKADIVEQPFDNTIEHAVKNIIRI